MRVLALLLCSLSTAAFSQLPDLNLTVSLREINESDAQEGAPNVAGRSYGTAPSGPNFSAHQVRVRNGERASLQIEQSMPMLWIQQAQAHSATLAADFSKDNASTGNIRANSHSGGFTQGLTTMTGGQQFTVTPSWPGAGKPVMVKIDIQSAVVDERISGDLPATTRKQFTSTINAMPNQWVTLASSGSTASAGSYSSTRSANARRLIQLRVSTE
ncbi:MAG: hypothetical protein IPH35_20075 [Rhodoferax sp.]|nr:hypothetical protein [Rhodoferax sp.]